MPAPVIWIGTHQKFGDAFTFVFEETPHGTRQHPAIYSRMLSRMACQISVSPNVVAHRSM